MLVLPAFETMTPALLRRVEELVAAGATVVGSPPDRSPSLSDYPQCDAQIHDIVQRVWGEQQRPAEVSRRKFGQGEVVVGGDLRCGQDAGPTNIRSRAPSGSGTRKAIPRRRLHQAQRFFHRAFALDASERVTTAQLEMTADNAFQVWVNGRLALQGDNFHMVYRADVSSLLNTGNNVLRVAATNGADNDNPAGVIGALEIRFENGGRRDVITDDTWLSTQETDAGLVHTRQGGRTLDRCAETRRFNMSPWLLDPAAGETTQLVLQLWRHGPTADRRRRAA